MTRDPVEDGATLRDDARALELVRSAGVAATSAARTYWRHKPGESSLVGFDFTTRSGLGDDVVVPGYVKAFADPARAEALAAKWAPPRAAGTSLGAGVRLLPGGTSVLFLFPNDGALRGLEDVVDLDKLKRTLTGVPGIADAGWRIKARGSTLRTLRYKPERRFVARADLRLIDRGRQARRRESLILRFFPDDRGDALLAMSAALRAGTSPPRLPEPRAALLGGSLYVEEAVEGTELHDLLLSDGASPGPVVEGLLRWRASPPLGTCASPEPEIHERTLADLARSGAPPELERVLAGRLERLRPAAEERRLHAVHGDLHLHQIIITGREACFVDLERARTGDPLEDVGSLAAHLLSKELAAPEHRARLAAFRRELLAAYRSLVPPRPASDLAWFVACGLIKFALISHRKDTACQRRLLVAELELAGRILEKESVDHV